MERYIKFITREAGSGYWNTEYTKDDGDMDVLGSFLSSEVGCYEPSFKEWAERNDYIGYGGNITELEKDDNYIYLSYDPYIFEGAEVSKFPRQAFIDLLEEWKRVCIMRPQNVLITYDGEKFTVTTSEEVEEQQAVP